MPAAVPATLSRVPSLLLSSDVNNCKQNNHIPLTNHAHQTMRTAYTIVYNLDRVIINVFVIHWQILLY